MTVVGGIDFSNIIEDDSMDNVAQYDPVKDKIILHKGDISILRNALSKVNAGEQLTPQEENIIRVYAHELNHRIDIKSGQFIPKGMGDRMHNLLSEAYNEIRSWGIASKLMKKDATIYDLTKGTPAYRNPVGYLLGIGEAIGIKRADFVREIQKNTNGNIGIALSKASNGRINAKDAQYVVNSVFTDSSTRKMLDKHGEHLMDNKETAKFLSDRHLGINGKRIPKEALIPKDFFKGGQVAFDMKERQRYKKYYGL